MSALSAPHADPLAVTTAGFGRVIMLFSFAVMIGNEDAQTERSKVAACCRVCPALRAIYRPLIVGHMTRTRYAP